MSEREPLDLRSLADVESPEVVRTALKRFRWRLLRRNLWIAMAVVVAVSAFLYAQQPHGLDERIDRSRVTTTSGQGIWHAGSSTVALSEVAELSSSTYGLRLVVVPEAPFVGSVTVSVRGQVDVERVGPWQWDFELPRSTDGAANVIVERSCDGTRCETSGTVSIDLRTLHVPQNIWKEGS